MAKMPKAPKFQNLPTLEGLVARRGQTVASLLEEWGVKDSAALNDRLKREGLAPVEDPSKFFPAPAKKVQKETEVEQKPESKKPAKAKLTSDALVSDLDRAPTKPAVVVSEEVGKPTSKA